MLSSLSTSLAVPGAVDDDVFPRQVLESIASSFLCWPAVGWRLGVDALDSHEQVGQTCEGAFGCSGSHVKRALTISATIHEVRVGEEVCAPSVRHR